VPTNIGNVEAYDFDEGNEPGVSLGEVEASVAAVHASGARAICYVETGGWESYRSDASAYSSAILGSTVSGYSNERYADIRQWSDDPGPTGLTLGKILTARFQLCQAEGFDAVETDLDDTYTESTGFPLTMANEVTFMTEMASVIHGLGMAWFLKNDINGDNLLAEIEPLADGTVNEQCWQYDECSALQPFVQAGKPVLNVEYANEAEATTCPEALAFPTATLQTDVDLDGNISWACWQYGSSTGTTTTLPSNSPSSTMPPVSLPARAPHFASPSWTAGRVGRFLSFQVRASGNPLPALGHSRLPSGLRWTGHGPGTAIISGVPKAGAAGLTRVSLYAINSRGHARQVLTIGVQYRPGLLSGAPPPAAVGRWYHFVLSAYGYPVPSVNQRGTLPAGLVLTGEGNGHAVISGRPAPGSEGSFRLSLRVTNAVGTLTVHYALRVTARAATTRTSPTP
jgi:hypothetical protein